MEGKGISGVELLCNIKRQVYRMNSWFDGKHMMHDTFYNIAYIMLQWKVNTILNSSLL